MSAYAVLGAVTPTRDEFFGPSLAKYRVFQLLPNWNWQTWLLLTAIIIAAAILEGAYQQHRATTEAASRGKQLIDVWGNLYEPQSPRTHKSLLAVLGVVALIAAAWLYSSLNKSTAPQDALRHSDTSVQFQRPEVQSGIPLAVSTPLVLKQVLINRGREAARAILWGFDVAFTDLPPTTDTEEVVWKAFIARAELGHVRDSGNDLGQGNYRWMTTEPKSFSVSDIADLQAGRVHLYVTGLALYRDRRGELQSELCVYLQPPGNPVVWRRCEGHNVVGRVGQFVRSARAK
ncbi:MAG: hypothetical protein HY694_03630 [Deltaproteobacteria bacterium]|nr:hypothetical protein [Deltaproteobacteria bacterium]